MNRAAPSWVLQPSTKASSSGSKDRGKIRRELPPVANPSDDEPLSDKAEEPKPKSCRWDPTLDLVVIDDDSTPLPGKTKSMGKKSRSQNPGKDEGFEMLSQCLKGKARAIQYNLKLAVLTEYQNLHIPNLKGPLNTNDHSKYLSNVKDVSWNYLTKGNIITAHQFFQNLKSSKDQEAIDLGENVLWEKGMLGILQESLKAGLAKCGMLYLFSIVSRA